MISLLNWLWGRQEDDVHEEPTSYLDHDLCRCDRFGKALGQYLSELTPDQQAIAQRLIPALLELGKGSHPPSDLTRFLKMTYWARYQQYHRFLINEWWQILQNCAQLHNSSWHQSADDCCPINRHNLPVARAIIWLHIHLKKSDSVASLLPFMANCLQQYPHCSEIAEQLAMSAANSLVRQPFYRFHQYNIAMKYPILSRGRMGRRLQIQAMRWAS